MKRASFNFLSGVGYSVIAVVDCSSIRTLSSLNCYCLGILFLCCFTPCVITDFITQPFITSYQKDLSLGMLGNGAHIPSTLLLRSGVFTAVQLPLTYSKLLEGQVWQTPYVCGSQAVTSEYSREGLTVYSRSGRREEKQDGICYIKSITTDLQIYDFNSCILQMSTLICLLIM